MAICTVMQLMRLFITRTLDLQWGHFTFWICPFTQQNHFVYSQTSRSKFILIIIGIYMSLNIYYYYTKGERCDADQ